MEIVQITAVVAVLALGVASIYAFERSRQRLIILRAKVDAKGIK